MSIIEDIGKAISQLFTNVDTDVIFFIGIGLEVLFTIFYLVKSRFSYEMRVVRRLLKINNWLNKNRYIDQNNLIEFNNMMKHTPKHLRYYWHQYMINRDKDPSHYLSTYNLVEKPLKSSSYITSIKDFKTLSIVFASLIFIVHVLSGSLGDWSFQTFGEVLITPFIMLFVCAILSMIMRMRQNMNVNSLFQYAHYFGRFLDRAVTTMPEYVDFEILFTPKEIKKGIPVLNEYLEKRARQEQEELEKARLNAVEHETYDFSSAGVNGSLVLDRAINEAETFLNIRSRLLSEIQQLEDEIESTKRTYDNTEKDYQKKLQVSKENVDRLRKQQEETTNRIENNYIKKQQADEIKKQEQLEKDHDAATIRFNQEIETLTSEINSRKKDLEERRKYVEDAMKAEYQTFSTKLYKSLSVIMEEEIQDEKDELVSMKDEISGKLQEANETITDQNREIVELKNILLANNIDFNSYMNYRTLELQKEAKRAKRNKTTNSKDEHKKLYGTEVETKTKATQNQTQNVQINSVQVVPEQQMVPIIPQDPNLIPFEQIPEQDKQYGEDGGFYDVNGYYRYANGTYFTPSGEFHDEFGGWFEADGVTYHEPQMQPAQSIENFQNQQSTQETHRRMEDVPEEERVYGEDGGFYDSLGYYYYPNGAFYTPDKRYFDEFGGWYEADGVTYHESGVGLQQRTVENTRKKMEDVPEEERIYKEDGGFFDKEGNYFYPNGAYFTPDGRYFDELGGWYEADGVTYHPADENAEPITVPQQQNGQEDTLEFNAPRYDDEDDDDEDDDEEVSLNSQAEMQKLKDQFNLDFGHEEDQENDDNDENAQEEDFDSEEVKDLADNSEETDLVNEDAEEFVAQEPAKRGRGRPRKIKPDDESGTLQPKPAKRGRGRPRKIKPSDDDETLQPKPAKRGRGRPRKIKPSDDGETLQPKPAKRGRGRPRKAVAEGQEIKRSRGRPKKVASSEASNTQYSGTATIKRGRGRPKKTIGTGITNPNKPTFGEYDELMEANNPELEALNQKIASEHKKLTENQEELDKQLTETLFNLSDDDK